MTDIEIAHKYFEDNPEAKDEVWKAYFAHHASHREDNAHYFTNGSRDCPCRNCGRTREQVRWDDLPAECSNHVAILDIKETIFNEEQRAFALLARAEREIPSLVKKLGGKLTSEVLKYLHETHGFDEETVREFST